MKTDGGPAREECTCIKLPVGGRLPMDGCPVHPPDVAEDPPEEPLPCGCVWRNGVMPHGCYGRDFSQCRAGHTNEKLLGKYFSLPDVAEPRSVECTDDRGHKFSYDGLLEVVTCDHCGHWKEPNALNPPAHHDETHGYHTADGEPVVKAQSSVDVVEALILNRDVKERRGYSYDAKLLTDAIAEIGRLAKELWSCPECAFTFDAVHVDEMSADYSCPACAELRLGAENTKLREALERLDDELSEPLWLDVALPRLRKMIANALAAEAMEGK